MRCHRSNGGRPCPPGAPMAVRDVPARNKLRAWCARTPQPWDVPADPTAVLLSLAAVGDHLIPLHIAKALCDVPPPVRDYCLTRVTWLGIGLALGGWCGARIDFGDRPWLLPVAWRADEDGDKFAGLVAHEAAHAWRGAEPAPGVVLRSAFADWTIRDTPMEHVPAASRVLVASLRADDAREERETRALVQEWGFCVV